MMKELSKLMKTYVVRPSIKSTSQMIDLGPNHKRRRNILGGEGAQCVELELRWQFCVHSSACPEIYIFNQSFE